MHHDDPHLEDRSRLVSRAHRRALVWVTLCWGVTLTVLLAVQMAGVTRAWTSAYDTTVVALGSLLVAYFAMVPGLLKTVSETFFRMMLLGISIRLLGTVALFLTCRYQLASSADVIAGMTIGWYLLLTSVEVIAVSRFLSASAVNRHAQAVESDHLTNEVPTAT